MNHTTAFYASYPGLDWIWIKCPICSAWGYLIQEWIHAKRKPIRVVHRGSKLRICSLESPQLIEQAFQQIQLPIQLIFKLLKWGKCFVLFSGGKDSLCTLDYMVELGSQIGVKPGAIHVDTTVGIPQVEDFVVEVCSKMNVELITLRPEQDFFELAAKHGIPQIKRRWCCEYLKQMPISRFLAGIPGFKAVFDGIRKKDSRIRRYYLPVRYHPRFKCLVVSPIFNWSDSQIEARVSRLISELGIQPPWSKFNFSAECFCGVYAKPRDFQELYRICPELFWKFAELERMRHWSIFYKGRKIWLDELIIQ